MTTLDKHWTVKRSQLERRQLLYCTTIVRRRPRLTTTWRPPIACLTSIASLHEDDAKSVEQRGGFGWCFVLGTRVIVFGDTRERCVHPSFPLGFLLTRLKVAMTNFGETNFGLPHLTATGHTILSDIGQPERTDFGHMFWWPALARPTLANLGVKKTKTTLCEGRVQGEEEGRQKTDQKKRCGTINIVHVLGEGVAGRRRRLHTKHGLCPPLGFQRTFMSSIARGLGFR